MAIVTFADKAKEINKRYGIKSTKDIANLSQIEAKSYNAEMDRLKEKQEQARQEMGKAQEIPGQEQTLNTAVQGMPPMQGVPQYGYGGQIKMYDNGGGVNNLDAKTKVRLNATGYSKENQLMPYETDIEMTQAEKAQYQDRIKRLESAYDKLRKKGIRSTDVIDEKDKDVADTIKEIRDNQTVLNKFIQEKTGGKALDYGSLGTTEGGKPGQKYTYGDFLNNSYFGPRSSAFHVKLEDAPNQPQNNRLAKDENGNWIKNPLYTPMKTSPINDVASAVSSYLPDTQKVYEKPVAYNMQKAGYVNYAPEREQLIQQGVLQGENLGRGLVASGGTRGQVMQGMVQGRLGLNRNVGEGISRSFQNEGNTNANIYSQVEGANTDRLNKAVDANYIDSRYTEEENFLRKARQGKTINDLMQNLKQNKQRDAYINAFGNSDSQGNTKYTNINWLNGVNNNPAVNFNTPQQDNFDSYVQQNRGAVAIPRQQIPSIYPYNGQQQEFNVNPYGQKSYGYGGSLIGKYSFKRRSK